MHIVCICCHDVAGPKVEIGKIGKGTTTFNM